jgi:hypothetical protein
LIDLQIVSVHCTAAAASALSFDAAAPKIVGKLATR